MADDRPRTLPVQGLVNRLVQGLSRVPLVSRLIGRNLIILYVVGRKSGKRYTVPVAYTRHDGALLVGSAFGWGRNLRSGEPIEVRYLGKRRPVDVVVVSDEDGVVADYAVIARANHHFGAFNNVGYDADGNPEPADLHRAWAAGARVFRLAPR
jgi:deazaflavin-dependent oxidoreductase (nitroreductase family)